MISPTMLRYRRLESPLLYKARKIRGVPDGTGPYGRGAGPGGGRADGTGLKRKLKNKPDGTGPYGKGLGPGQGKADGTGLKSLRN